MIELEGVDLTKIVYFEKATLNFEPGITFIKGRNKQRRGAGASNGAGKSLLVGVLPNLAFDSHPVITKNGRSVQKQIYGKGSSAALRFKSNAGTSYKYVKRGSATELHRGAKNLKSRMARDTLRKLLADITEEEFYSTIFIDGRRNNNFQLGTSSERFQFITNLFRLHDMDALRKQFRKELNDLRSDSSLYDRLKADLVEAKKQVADLPADAETEADRMGQKLRATTDQISDINADLLRHETYAKYRKVLGEFKALEVPEKTATELKKQLRGIQEYQAALQQYKKQCSLQSQLKLELDELNVTNRDLAAWAEMSDRRLSLRSMQERLAETGIEERPEPPEMDRKRVAAVAKNHPTVKVTRLRDVNLTAVKQRTSALSDFIEAVGDETECPTCHSPLDSKTKKKIKVVLQEALAEATTKFERYAKMQAACKARDAWLKYDAEIAAYSEYEKTAELLSVYPFKTIEKYHKLKARLQSFSIEKPEAVEGDEESINAQLALWAKHSHLKQVSESLRTDKPTVTVDGAKDSLLKLRIIVNKLMSRLPMLQAQAELRKQAVSKVKALTAELAEMTARLQDLPVYEMLSDAYSASGLKLLLVRRIAAAIEANLNRYAKQVFSENFSFKIEIEDNKFDIIVTRRARIKGIAKTSDVRHLSGAEGRLFVFLQLLSLLPLIPSNRRMNVMILDEPSANMDNETLEIFRDVLLPLLQKIVPCLIVVSPDPAVVTHHSRIYTVVKDGGVSTLVKGDVP